MIKEGEKKEEEEEKQEVCEKKSLKEEEEEEIRGRDEREEVEEQEKDVITLFITLILVYHILRWKWNKDFDRLNEAQMKVIDELSWKDHSCHS